MTATVHLMAGQAAAARQEITRGLTASAERDARGYRAPLLRLDAESLAAEGDLVTARTRADEARALALELGTRPELAHCHATLAHIAGRAGDTATATTHHATARAIFDELGMTLWSARRPS